MNKQKTSKKHFYLGATALIILAIALVSASTYITNDTINTTNIIANQMTYNGITNINYTGINNAFNLMVGVNNNDSNQLALSVVSYNEGDTTLGVNGHEAGRGTIKAVHFPPISGVNDSSASVLSLLVSGGIGQTYAQGIYLDMRNSTGNAFTMTDDVISHYVIKSDGQTIITSNNTEAFLVQREDGTDAFKVDPVGSITFTKKTIPISTNIYDLGDATHIWRNITAQNILLTNKSGTGNAFACFDANGNLYRSATACA